MSATSPRKKSTSATPPKALDDFKYTTSDGKEIVLPPWKSAKPGVLRKLRKLSISDQFFTMLETLVEVRHREAFDAKRDELVAAARTDDNPEPEIDDDDVENELDEDTTLDVVDDLDPDEFQDFQRKWFKHSGIDLGE